MLTDYDLIDNDLYDDQFPCIGYTHERVVVRAFVYNDKNEFALEHIYGDDIFGHRDYYETPGGGVEEKENLEEALLRELDEEIGCKCEVIAYLGQVKDQYNTLKRKNINHYYLCKVKEYTTIHHVSKGDSLIERVDWVSLEEMKNIYQQFAKKGISKLVYQREYPFVEKLICKLKDMSLQ